MAKKKAIQRMPMNYAWLQSVSCDLRNTCCIVQCNTYYTVLF